MKITILLLLVSVCAFGQPSKRYKKSFDKDQSITTASSSGLDRKVIFSKGEALQEKD
jgi:hypothetical protein